MPFWKRKTSLGMSGRKGYRCSFASTDLWRETISFPKSGLKSNPDFDREKFIRDAEDFMEACEEEARRIDGDRGLSYLMYGLTALRI